MCNLPFTAITDFLSVVSLRDFPLLPRLVLLPDRRFLLLLSIVCVSRDASVLKDIVH